LEHSLPNCNICFAGGGFPHHFSRPNPGQITPKAWTTDLRTSNLPAPPS
jgi:hypothetical protein